MNGLEVTLLIVGFILIVASFIFSKELAQENVAPASKAELTDKQKDDIRKQVLEIFDEQASAITEKTEVTLDKLSAKKMSEMNEYSENIMNEINRNHNEVMFLYDMLNEKKKEVNNTVRDLNIANKEMAMNVSKAEELKVQKEQEEALKAMEEAKKTAEAPKPATKTTKTTTRTTKATQKADIEKANEVLKQLDAASEAVQNEAPAEDTEVKKPRKRTQTAKTAASRAKETIKKESTRSEIENIPTIESGNNNAQILELNAQGKSNVEIAKELGLGIGEVKLVIDLFRGAK